MNELSTSNNISSMILNDEGVFNRINQMAQMMSNSKSIPTHLQGDHGACFSVVTQSMRWGMDPFAVAQKMHVVKGNVGYEAQLINAVINSNAPVTGRFQYDFFGPWENILGKYEVCKNAEGKTYQKSNTTREEEHGCGVKIWATFIGEDKPRELILFMAQCTVRNSTLWATDPKQQLCYMAQKKWARLFCPDVILGVYTPDEMPSQMPEKNISDIASDEPVAPSVLDRNKKTEPVQEQAQTVEAEIVPDETITVKQIIDAVGLPKEQILAYHQALTDPSWHIDKSLSELNPQARKWMIENPGKVKSATEQFINSQNQQPEINAEQLKRLQIIKSASGKTEEYFKQYLKEMFGLTSSKQVTINIYDQVCEWIEKAPNAPK